MVDGSHESPARPPLGSWARLYALVCVLAVLVMAILWWFSSSFNVRLPR
jgi:hypothetical protein